MALNHYTTLYFIETIAIFENTKICSMKSILYKGLILTAIISLASCSGYEKLNRAIADPVGVTKLKIKWARLDSIPAAIGTLSDLKTLYLFKNGLDSIPDEIGNLKNLETLVISSNKLRSIPSSIGQLTKLKKLSLKHNRIKEVPSELGDLNELEELHLDYNALKKLPPEIGNLKSLEFLFLNDNLLQEIPKEIGNLSNLKFLVIGKNSLSSLPYEIGDLTNLTELNVAFCGPLVEIPGSISNCTFLEYLYIDQSIVLPYSIGSVNPRLKLVIKEKGDL